MSQTHTIYILNFELNHMIVTLKEFKIIRENIKEKRIVCTSGFFDPIHPGHVSIIRESKKYGDILVVVLNGNMQCTTKKGKPFIPQNERAYIIDNIKDVDYVVLYDHPSKLDCCEALEVILPNVFTKGGDRDSSKNVPEAVIVEGNGGRVEYNVGKAKEWSSSNYLEEWYIFKKGQENI